MLRDVTARFEEAKPIKVRLRELERQVEQNSE